MGKTLIFDKIIKIVLDNSKIKRYTVTAALPYTNGPVHIGHLAGVYLPADTYVRYLRSNKRDVKFICGSDENGVPITLKAKKEGVTPQEIVDKYHEIIGDSFKEFGVSFDIYHRTSSLMHHQTASDFFENLYEKGVFTEEVTEQYYDEKAQTFLADRYITGTCPKCGNENAYGDQCENCGSTLNATDLINPKSTLSGEKPVRKETKNWFLPLDKYEDQLRTYIEGHKEWRPNVYGQCQSWLNAGLQPRAMTRDLDWGVRVPVKDAEGKVLYVWFDAPIGYISATKELFEYARLDVWNPKSEEYYINKNTLTKGNWEDYWKDENTKLVHFIGKDNIVFHCVIFPAMLMAHGDYTLADNVPANEFLNLEGQKISTSKNWAVWLNEYLTEFKGQQDVLRYVLTATAPETKDNDFTWKDFQARNNNELVAILGNFINRVVVLTHKYFGGKVPMLMEVKPEDQQVIDELAEYPARISASIENYRFREALMEVMNVARLGNKYLADMEPWKVIKTDEDRVRTILNISLQIAANLEILIEPFLPFTADKLMKMLNYGGHQWESAGKMDLLCRGHQLNEPQLLFEKIEDETVQAQIDKLNQSKAANVINNAVLTPSKDNIQFEQFGAIDIRVATIIAAEKVEKTKKLLKLTLDTGLDQRTVVSGIAEFYKPEEIIGQQVSLIVNLAPREIKGILSQGMILMSENSEGKLTFVAPVQNHGNGSVIR
ncbi:methionine--tRNA ligase (methionyl-tRNA synthetase) [Pedobacter sp. BAL39]|uniref:methionine--tRNA ligase n=1 Tax=Pedobacter sp. BAL39 TaxID=391596 RepID=UPI000155A4AA|nr:methionine--tRNA ligase [Pedobacter sp. BAL39]EDM34500.1 methionine--tRNA ligase (methionyl-tRNA synthetase) [Pedobacter sp. BAL39]